MKPAAGEWVDLLERRLSTPACPPLPRGGQWTADDRRKWDIWRHDPAAEYWSEADIEVAQETLLLFHPPVIGLDREGNPVHGAPPWSEITRRQTALGLTPIGKRNLRYRVCFARVRDETLDGLTRTPVTDLTAARARLAKGA